METTIWHETRRWATGARAASIAAGGEEATAGGRGGTAKGGHRQNMEEARAGVVVVAVAGVGILPQASISGCNLPFEIFTPSLGLFVEQLTKRRGG